MQFKTLLVGLSMLLLFSAGSVAAHDDDHQDNKDCPVGLVSGMTLNDEFGPNSQGLTKCLSHRKDVNVVIQINQFCSNLTTPNAQCKTAYALHNIYNIISDYEVTNGMVPGRDYKIVAIVHSGGGMMVVKDSGTDGNGNPVSGRNQFEASVRDLISKGVDFYFCQNTTRGYVGAKILPTVAVAPGGATGELIPGVKYVTAGISAIADYQKSGYKYVQP